MMCRIYSLLIYMLRLGLSINFCRFFLCRCLKFYGNSVYIPIGCLLSVSLFFSTMNMVPNALLMKEKKFVRIGLRMITNNCCKQRYSNCIGKTRTEILRTCRAVYYTGYGQFYMELHSTRIKLRIKC